MSDKLSEEIMNQIDKEANRAFSLIRDVGKKIGYKKGAAFYAEKWQAAEQKIKELEEKISKMENEIESAGQLIIEHERYEKALKQIEEWQLPSTGQFWDDEETRPMSYESLYGSNGVRDYMRNVAREALTPKTSGDEN